MKKRIFTLFSLAFIGLITANAQVGIGTDTPGTSSIMELQSIDKGFLPPRMTSSQRDLITSPEEGLVIFNLDVSCLQVFDGLYWVGVCDDLPIVPTVIGRNGRIWMDRNLGATQVASSSTDVSSFGDLFQWGRAADGHEKRTSNTYNAVVSSDGVSNFFNNTSSAWYGKFILRNSGVSNWVDPSVNNVDNLWNGLDGVNNPCPKGFRIPTMTEWQAEHANFQPNNLAGAFASNLSLPAAGRRKRDDGVVDLTGISGRYWSSTVSGTSAVALIVESTSSTMSSNISRSEGLSVRCIRD